MNEEEEKQQPNRPPAQNVPERGQRSPVRAGSWSPPANTRPTFHESSEVDRRHSQQLGRREQPRNDPPDVGIPEVGGTRFDEINDCPEDGDAGARN